MKKKVILFAAIVAAFVSVTSGCAKSNVYYAAYHHSAWRGY